MKTAFALWEVASNEELMQAVLEYHLTIYSDIETYPITEYEKASKIIKMMASAQKYY
jgi:hypothetical protein